MKIVEWSDRAIVDLEEIDDYWLQYSGTKAEEISLKIEKAATFLATMPRAGPAIRGRAGRKWSVPTTRYLLVYRVIDDGIEVLRVHHGSQNWTGD